MCSDEHKAADAISTVSRTPIEERLGKSKTLIDSRVSKMPNEERQGRRRLREGREDADGGKARKTPIEERLGKRRLKKGTAG